MTRNVIVVAVALCATVMLSGGCKKSEDTMALMLAAMSGPEVYAGSSPEGDFIEVTIDRSQKKIDYMNYTTSENLADMDYTWLDPADAGSDPNPGGFSIFYRIDLPVPPYDAGDYVMFAEIPGEAVVITVFDEFDEMKEPPTFAFKRKNVAQSQYYKKAFNWLHVTVDDEAGKPDVMCGFVASDSAGTPTPNGRLYGAEYSIQDSTTSDINPEELGIGDLEKDPLSGAFVWWTAEPHAWDDSIVMIGNPASAAQLIYGVNQGGGGAFTVPQAAAKEFHTDYAGTYAVLLYQFDKGETEESVATATAVITTSGNIRVFEIGTDTTNDANLIFDEATLTPIEDYDTGSLIGFLNGSSLLNDGIVGASYAGIQGGV